MIQLGGKNDSAGGAKTIQLGGKNDSTAFENIN